VTVIIADFTSGDDLLVNPSLPDLGASDAYEVRGPPRSAAFPVLRRVDHYYR
jgi:hypothetical protein